MQYSEVMDGRWHDKRQSVSLWILWLLPGYWECTLNKVRESIKSIMCDYIHNLNFVVCSTKPIKNLDQDHIMHFYVRISHGSDRGIVLWLFSLDILSWALLFFLELPNNSDLPCFAFPLFAKDHSSAVQNISFLIPAFCKFLPDSIQMGTNAKPFHNGRGRN